jgi:hypothetical protein
MRRIFQDSCRVGTWSILAILLFLVGVAYVEQLFPELETQTQDEQALVELVYALKKDQGIIEFPQTPAITFIILPDTFGAHLGLNLLPQTGGGRLIKPPVLDLYQRLSTYRI